MSEKEDILFGEPSKLDRDDFIAIARLPQGIGGQALLTYVEQKIRGLTWALVKQDPNDIAAVAQFQAQVACYVTIRALLLADEEIYSDVNEGEG